MAQGKGKAKARNKACPSYPRRALVEERFEGLWAAQAAAAGSRIEGWF